MNANILAMSMVAATALLWPASAVAPAGAVADVACSPSQNPYLNWAPPAMPIMPYCFGNLDMACMQQAISDWDTAMENLHLDLMDAWFLECDQVHNELDYHYPILKASMLADCDATYGPGSPGYTACVNAALDWLDNWKQDQLATIGGYAAKMEAGELARANKKLLGAFNRCCTQD